MKYTALLATAATASALSTPHILQRQEEDERAFQQCLTNQCSSMYNTVENQCYSIIGDVDSETDMGQEQAAQFYSCICDAFRNASSDCKTCTANAGEDINSTTDEYCADMSSYSGSMSSTKTSSASTNAGSVSSTNSMSSSTVSYSFTSTSSSSSSSSPSPTPSDDSANDDDDDDDSGSVNTIPSVAFIASVLALAGALAL